MEEGIKNRIILILTILVLILFIATINAGLNARRINKELVSQKEMRFELEKKGDLLLKEKTALEKEKKSLSSQLEKDKEEFEEIKKDLQAEKLMTKVLKAELEKITKLKEKLEEDLKEALVIKPRR